MTCSRSSSSVLIAFGRSINPNDQVTLEISSANRININRFGGSKFFSFVVKQFCEILGKNEG